MIALIFLLASAASLPATACTPGPAAAAAASSPALLYTPISNKRRRIANEDNTCVVPVRGKSTAAPASAPAAAAASAPTPSSQRD